MKRAVIFLAVVAACALPVSASAVVTQTDYKNAAKFCKALRADMGTVTFRLAYGTSHSRSNAFGKCVSKSARLEHQAHSSAVTQCKSERDADAAAFATRYGTGKHGKNALGRCVSQKQDQAEQSEQEAIVNAAKQCRDERAKDPVAFREKYGTNHNKRNAFGKCVSTLSKQNKSESHS